MYIIIRIKFEFKRSWNKYKGTFDAVTRIAKEEGISKLYSGIVPSLIGITHVAVQFPLYEFVKTTISKKKRKSLDELNVSEILFASSISKMVASTLTYPHEVII